jgi:ABC-type bacteriocin/lantibiotic exporter with double-glycine peptidase domain
MEERREEYIGIIEAFPVLYLFVIYVAIRPVLWEIIVSALVGVASAAIASIFLKGKADVTYEDKTWDREIDASKMTNQEAVDALEEYCTWIGNRRKELDDIVNGSCARTRNAISTTTWLLAIFSVVNIVVFCLTYRALL